MKIFIFLIFKRAEHIFYEKVNKMENKELKFLLQALTGSDNKLRQKAENFVNNKINNCDSFFVQEIFNALSYSNLTVPEACYAFIILQKSIDYVPFKNEVLEICLKYFENDNEQVRIFASNTYTDYFVDIYQNTNDESFIINIFNLLNKNENNFNSFYSCLNILIRIIFQNMIDSLEIKQQIYRFVFNLFLYTETIEITLLLLHALIQLTERLPEEYILNEQFQNKLLLCLDNNELKCSTYRILAEIANFHYHLLSNMMNNIISISCFDLNNSNDLDLVNTILTFWYRIADIEVNETYDILCHYVATASTSIIPILLLLMKNFANNEVENELSWDTPQMIRSIIKMFDKCCPNAIYPILIAFIQQSNDDELTIYILAIIFQINDKSFIVGNIQQIMEKLTVSVQSNNPKLRHAALYTLLKIVRAKDFDYRRIPLLNVNYFQQLLQFTNIDIEQNAELEFKIVVASFMKLPHNEQVNFIIRFLPNIPFNYLVKCVDIVDSFLIEPMAGTWQNELTIKLIIFFHQFLEQSLNDDKCQELVMAISTCMIHLLTEPIPLDAYFDNILGTLMKSFSKFQGIQNILCISYLFLADQNSSGKHLQEIVNFFLSLLNHQEMLNEEISFTIISVISALLLHKDSDFIIQPIVNTLSSLYSNRPVIDITFDEAFFAICDTASLHNCQISHDLLQLIFTKIQFYASETQNIYHNYHIKFSNIYEPIISFLGDFVAYSTNIPSQLFSIIITLLESLDKLYLTNKELKETVNSLLVLLAVQYHSEIYNFIKSKNSISDMYIKILIQEELQANEKDIISQFFP